MSDDRQIAHVDASLAPLVPRYLERRRTDVASIRAAVESGRFPEAQSIGHSMKGSGGGYGFDPITEIGGRIENSAMIGDGPAVLAATDELEAYIGVVEVVFVDE